MMTVPAVEKGGACFCICASHPKQKGANGRRRGLRTKTLLETTREP